MKGYQIHLEQMYNVRTFGRKVDYVKYNFFKAIPGVSKDSFEVLDIGPGMGELVSYVNSLGVKSIDIADNDRSVISYLTDKFKVRKSFLIKDTSSIGKLVGKYDLIFMIQVLEHISVDKHVQLITTLYSHLKKNGRLVAVVPNANNPLGLPERYGDLQHQTAFTTMSLKDLAREAGVGSDRVEIRGFEIPPYSLVNIIRIVLQKVLHAVIYLAMIVNGGVYFGVLTPNVVLVLRKSG